MKNKQREYTVASIGADQYNLKISRILPHNTSHLVFDSSYIGNDIKSSIKNSLNTDPHYVVLCADPEVAELIKLHTNPGSRSRVLATGEVFSISEGRKKLGKKLDSLSNTLPNQNRNIQTMSDIDQPKKGLLARLMIANQS